VHDTFGWHAHAYEDELFVVPRGVRHNPSADDSRW
jgi:hypothetical protein